MYFIHEEDGYILSIQKGGAGSCEITEAEYDAILEVIANRPEPPAGYDYRLKSDLTWEMYELPAPDPDPEISEAEALGIILGGEG